MQTNPSLKISISGHTDNKGDDEFNMNLSKRRAKAVQEYIISKGIDADRISSKGFGETKPIESNLTRKGRAANRRTEFEIIIK